MVIDALQKAIVAEWNTELSAVPLAYGRVPEGTDYPRAIYFDVDNTNDPAFSAGVIDYWVYQFSYFHSDPADVAAKLETIANTFQRAKLTLSSGQSLSTFRLKAGMQKMPKQTTSGTIVYMGWVRVRFTIDN